MSDGISTVRYFEGSSFVGSREAYLCGAEENGQRYSTYWPHTAYFCPVCGEIWGREIYDYHPQYLPRENLRNSHWVAEIRRCPQHGDGQFLTGKPLTNVSPELLRREALVLLLNSKDQLP